MHGSCLSIAVQVPPASRYVLDPLSSVWLLTRGTAPLVGRVQHAHIFLPHLQTPDGLHVLIGSIYDAFPELCRIAIHVDRHVGDLLFRWHAPCPPILRPWE